MASEISLDKLTIDEKLQLMEQLWDDLSRHPENVPSPDWHGDVLDQRRRAIAEGRTSFEDWDEVKQRLRTRIE